MGAILVLAAACGKTDTGGGPGGDGVPSVAGHVDAKVPSALPEAPADVAPFPLSAQRGADPITVDAATTYLVDVLHTAFTLKSPAPKLRASADLQSGSVVVFGQADSVDHYFMLLDPAELRAFEDPYPAASNTSDSEHLIARTKPLPDDLVSWVAGRPFVADPIVTDVTIGGLPGRQVEFTENVAETAPMCGTEARCASLFANPENGFKPSIFALHPELRRRLVQLHAPAGDLILISGGTPEAQASIDSIRFFQRPTRVAGAVTTATFADVAAGAVPVTDQQKLDRGAAYLVDSTNFVVPFTFVAPVDEMQFFTRVGALVIEKPGEDLFMADYSHVRTVSNPYQDLSKIGSHTEFEAATAAAPADPLEWLKSLPFVEVVDDIHHETISGMDARVLRYRLGALASPAPSCSDRPVSCVATWYSSAGMVNELAAGDLVTVATLTARNTQLLIEIHSSNAASWLSSLHFLDK